MARRVRRAFVRPAAKTKIWIGAGVGTTTVGASTLVLLSSLSAAALLLRPFTILRTRQLILFQSDQIAASERPQGDFGEIIVKDSAIAAGAASIPDPSSTDGDPDAEWYVHQPLIDNVVVGATTVNQEPVGKYFEIDSKAMRKVGINEDIAQMVSETGVVGFNITIRGRQLIQLH